MKNCKFNDPRLADVSTFEPKKNYLDKLSELFHRDDNSHLLGNINIKKGEFIEISNKEKHDDDNMIIDNEGFSNNFTKFTNVSNSNENINNPIIDKDKNIEIKEDKDNYDKNKVKKKDKKKDGKVKRGNKIVYLSENEEIDLDNVKQLKEEINDDKDNSRDNSMDVSDNFNIKHTNNINQNTNNKQGIGHNISNRNDGSCGMEEEFNRSQNPTQNNLKLKNGLKSQLNVNANINKTKNTTIMDFMKVKNVNRNDNNITQNNSNNSNVNNETNTNSNINTNTTNIVDRLKINEEKIKQDSEMLIERQAGKKRKHILFNNGHGGNGNNINNDKKEEKKKK